MNNLTPGPLSPAIGEGEWRRENNFIPDPFASHWRGGVET